MSPAHEIDHSALYWRRDGSPSVEASALELPPGNWPDVIRVRMKSGRAADFERGLARRDREGELLAVSYTYRGPVTGKVVILTVFND